jgi:vancomycin resistance protein YoaR
MFSLFKFNLGGENRNRLIILFLIIVVLFIVTNLVSEEIKRNLYGVAPGVIYEGQELGHLFRGEVYQVVREDAIKKRVLSKGATIDSKSGKIIEEKVGWIIDIESTTNKIMEAKSGAKVSADIYKINPYMTKKILDEITKVIGSYHTFISGSLSRLRNIKIATIAINNHLVLAQERFSFNQVVGPRTKVRGYQEGPVIFDGIIRPGVGGGVCQVSSTLYNAVQEADLNIIERYPHSNRVRYVPPGQDAAVAWNLLDFKFYNQYLFPVIIKANVYGRKLVIKILGKEG